MLERAQQLQARLSEIRRWLHMHPELGFEELQTSQYVSDQLNALGIEHQRGIARTGIVATLGNGDGPTIALRADMDALPITEANDVPYKSHNEGVMHACGHDAHTAMLLGAAMLLSQEKINGTVRLLFQPSEERRDDENKSGGLRMVEEGALKDVEAVWGLHVRSTDPLGTIYCTEGPITAASDRFAGHVIGKGGHAARPHTALDPIWMSVQVLSAIYGIIPRRLDPTKRAVITIGKVQAGTAANIIPPSLEIVGTIRTYDHDVRELVHAELERAFSIARTLGGSYTLSHPFGYPPTINDPTAIGLARQVATDLVGESHVATHEAGMGGEDFSYMAQQAKGGFIYLGAAIGDKHRPHHNPVFDIDERILPIGSALLAETVRRYLQK